MSGRNRLDIKVGTMVQVVQKQDQRTAKLTEGTVKDILTKSSTHPHGIKVRLINGGLGFNVLNFSKNESVLVSGDVRLRYFFQK
jgi:uncharacterized repeat protein (TIGR03833 family)